MGRQLGRALWYKVRLFGLTPAEAACQSAPSWSHSRPAAAQVPTPSVPVRIIGSHPEKMGKGAGETPSDSTVAHESIGQLTAELDNVKIGTLALQLSSPAELSSTHRAAQTADCLCLQSLRLLALPPLQRPRLPRASLTA